MRPKSVVTSFLEWLEHLFFREKPAPPPPLFGDSTVVQWRDGEFTCKGIFRSFRPSYLYELRVKPVRAVRKITPAETRWKNENLISLVPTHRFELVFFPPVVKNGRVALGTPVRVFCIERSCFIATRKTTDPDWIATMEVAPKVRDHITEIAKSPATELVYRIKGKIYKEGETVKSGNPGQMVSFERPNTIKIELLTPFSNETQKQWEEFIDQQIAISRSLGRYT